MGTPKNWTGYKSTFLDGFDIPIPQPQDDAAPNKETGKVELPFIHFTAIQSKSRRVPILTASNIYRDKFMSISADGDDKFQTDDRLADEHQLNTTLYKLINKGHPSGNEKMAKGHMARREDVQWDIDKNATKAEEASDATFHYSNACPQYQGVNNGIWKALENSVLVRGYSREPKKCIVFTGPIFHKTDPLLNFQGETDLKVQCALRFWKVIYWVNTDNKLCRAGFIMSHKEEVEAARFVKLTRKVEEYERMISEVAEKPFLGFDEKKRYQVHVSEIGVLTKLNFHAAEEKLAVNENRELSLPVKNESFEISGEITDESDLIVEGLVV